MPASVGLNEAFVHFCQLQVVTPDLDLECCRLWVVKLIERADKPPILEDFCTKTWNLHHNGASGLGSRYLRFWESWSDVDKAMDAALPGGLWAPDHIVLLTEAPPPRSWSVYPSRLLEMKLCVGNSDWDHMCSCSISSRSKA